MRYSTDIRVTLEPPSDTVSATTVSPCGSTVTLIQLQYVLVAPLKKLVFTVHGSRFTVHGLRFTVHCSRRERERERGRKKEGGKEGKGRRESGREGRREGERER